MPSLSGLGSVEIHQSSGGVDEGYASFTGAKSLRINNNRYFELVDAYLGGIEAPILENLELVNFNIVGFKYLANFPRLKHLYFKGTFTAVPLASELKSLRTCRLSGASRQSDFLFLHSARDCTALQFEKSFFPDSLPSLPQVKHLTLSRIDGIGDTSFLKKFESLESLHVCYVDSLSSLKMLTQLSESGIRTINIVGGGKALYRDYAKIKKAGLHLLCREIEHDPFQDADRIHREC